MNDSGQSVHPVAASGFGRGAEDYELGRPGYPPEAVDHIFEAFNLGSDGSVLDLGAGTGKLTRLLVGRGIDIIAVEPVDAMAAILARTVPSVRRLAGAAEAIPLRDDSVAAVTAAQAAHWFDPAPAAVEIRRVLQPAGGLALIWNGRRTELPPWTAIDPLTETYRRLAPQSASDEHLEEALIDAGFDRIDFTTYDHVERLSPDAFVARVMSTSSVAAFAGEESGALRDRILATLDGEQIVTVPYETKLVLYRAPNR